MSKSELEKKVAALVEHLMASEPASFEWTRYIARYTKEFLDLFDEHAELYISIPEYLRKGQNIFNFLEWLRVEKRIGVDQDNRMADPYHLTDSEWDTYYQEYLEKECK